MNERVTVDALTTDERTERKLSYALRLARLGLYVAPLLPGSKAPYTGESWSNMRTRDPAVIRDWFASRSGMNYAVIPGEDFVVLDLDVKPARGNRPAKDGVRDLDALAADAADFIGSHALTFTVRTPSGGLHRGFRSPFAVANAHTLPKSIDVRGNEGYVVGPGCWTAHNPVDGTSEGEYAVTIDSDFAPLPAWIVPRLKPWTPRADRPSYEDSVELIDGKAFVDGVELDTDAAMERAKDWLRNGAKPAIEGQGGNATTFATFAWLREHAVSASLAFELVKLYYNPRCEPRWSREELEQLCENAYRYAKRDVQAQDTMNRRDLEAESEIVAESTDVATLLTVTQPEPSRDEVCEKLESIVCRGMQLFERIAPKEFVIPRVLPASGYVGFLAKRGTGKTSVLVDMGLRLAHDMDWHNLPTKKDWGVLYLAGEDAEGIPSMARAWMQKHAVAEINDRFVLMPRIVDLLNPSSVAEWLPFCTRLARGRRFLVIGDTWQRATAGASQIEDDKMQAAVSNIERIARAVNGVAVMAAHPPKGNETTWSGSAVLENHSQALWLLSDETFGKRFYVERIKGTQAGHYTLLNFEKIDVGGPDEWGFPNTGIVPVAIGGEGRPSDSAVIDATAAYARAILAVMNEDARKEWAAQPMADEINKRIAAGGLPEIDGDRVKRYTVRSLALKLPQWFAKPVAVTVGYGRPGTLLFQKTFKLEVPTVATDGLPDEIA